MKLRAHSDRLILDIDAALNEMTVTEILAGPLRLGREFSKSLLLHGKVSIAGNTVLGPTRVKEGQRLVFTSINDTREFRSYEAAEPLQVRYEDEHLLVVNKEAPLLIHSDGEGTSPTLDDKVFSYLQQEGAVYPGYHVHRLDLPTTGAVLYAKHKLCLSYLDSELTRRTIHRTYIALVSGNSFPANRTFDGSIGRDRHVNGKYRVASTGKTAITHVRRLWQTKHQGETLSLLQCTLDTGRTHQIRVHLSNFGASILGDDLYGGRLNTKFRGSRSNIALHAIQLNLDHPYEGSQIQAEAPLPVAWRRYGHELPGLQEALQKAGRTREE